MRHGIRKKNTALSNNAATFTYLRLLTLDGEEQKRVPVGRLLVASVRDRELELYESRAPIWRDTRPSKSLEGRSSGKMG